jgi:hypothetical protein
MQGNCLRLSLTVMVVAAALTELTTATTPEEELLALIRKDQPYTLVPAPLFEKLGWDLPDGGSTVKGLAEGAPGGAFYPKDLESLPAAKLGYRAKWHVIRYSYYGLPWDITGLYLEPVRRIPGLPTITYINGGASNLYEFFVDPLNNPGIGQYLAQHIPVLIISIPGNYRNGGWEGPIAGRQPQYVLDRDLSAKEARVRHSIFTNAMIAEGIARVIHAATSGPLLIAGHSTGGEFQFILKDRLKDRLRSRSIGWGTGGPASLRRKWEVEAAAERNSGKGRVHPPVSEMTYSAGGNGEPGPNLGPLNPVPGDSRRVIADKWRDLEKRRRPHFKQAIQNVEHFASLSERESAEKTIRRVVAESGLPVDAEQVIKDLYLTVRSPLEGYERMIWTTALLDDGHWDSDPTKARELFIGNVFREKNPKAPIRVVVYDVPMSHYGHIEKPKQLAGGTLAAVKWLYE